MAFVLNDRVKETTTSTGTGTINLAGAATGFETFVAGVGNSNVTYYCIAHQTAAEFEVGIGTVTDASPDTLSRTTILSSSNSDSAVNFSAGTKDVFCTLPASKTIREFDTALNVPTGTTAQRSSSPAAGDLRFNTTSSKFEGYSGSAWGNVGVEGNFLVTNIFAGDGSDTTFTISNAVANENNLLVFIDGVFQAHDSYSVSGTTVTFSTAPANGRVITIYSALNNVQGADMVIATMTGDNSDTTLDLGVTPVSENNVQVYIDGTYQNKDTYSISGQTLTFSTAPPTGTAVEAITHTVTDISAAASSVLVDEFTGDGSDTTFTLSAAPANENNTQVFVGGVYQEKATYSISNAVLTFTAAPANGVSIEVVSIAVGQINSAVQLSDADGDTKVMVEESSDEDKIRFDTGGTERMIIDDTGDVGIGTSTINSGTLGPNNKFLEVAAGSASGSGTLVLSRATNTNNDEVGGIRYVNANNADDDGLDADGKMIAAISARAVTTDSNAGDDSGGALTFSTKPEAGSFTERMRILSDGKIGIGTDSPASELHISSSAPVITGTATNNNSGLRVNVVGGGNELFRVQDNGTTTFQIDGAGDVSISAGKLTTSGANGADNQGLNITDTGYSKTHKIYGDNSLHIQADSGQQILFKPNATEAARFDASGNLGIGTSTITSSIGWSPNLVISDTSAAVVLKGVNNQENAIGVSNGFYIDSLGSTTASYNQILFRTSNTNSNFSATERMRIHSDGRVNIGGQGDGGKFYVYGDTAGAYLSRFHHDGNDNDRYGIRLIVGADNASTGQYWLRFDDGDGHAQGYLYHDSGSVVINQASDERLKENIVDSTLEGINTLKNIKQREFNWKRDADKTKVIGYIAQELESVYPAAVTINGDKSGEGIVAPEDDPDNPYKYLAKEKLIDVLIKAGQEQQVIIEDLKARIETLEGS